jgi:hypothetical protein
MPHVANLNSPIVTQKLAVAAISMWQGDYYSKRPVARRFAAWFQWCKISVGATVGYEHAEPER